MESNWETGPKKENFYLTVTIPSLQAGLLFTGKHGHLWETRAALHPSSLQTATAQPHDIPGHHSGSPVAVISLWSPGNQLEIKVVAET